MANTLLTPSTIASAALATLYENAVLPSLVHRDYDADFNGKRSDTITVRKPAVFTANEFARPAGIVIQDATETGVPVVLDTLLDVSFSVTDEELSLDIVNFTEQFLTPAMEAIIQGLDAKLVAQFATATTTVAVTGATDLVDVATALTANSVPLTMRRAVHNSANAGVLQKDPLFHQADQRGDTEGLREATIGRKFGFDNYVDQNFDGVTPPVNFAGAAFHQSAVALVTRTLDVPMGGARGATASYKGIGLRVVYDYDINQKEQIISIDTLCGAATLDDDRMVALTSV